MLELQEVDVLLRVLLAVQDACIQHSNLQEVDDDLLCPLHGLSGSTVWLDHLQYTSKHILLTLVATQSKQKTKANMQNLLRQGDEQ